jgi:hypothetical protein
MEMNKMRLMTLIMMTAMACTPKDDGDSSTAGEADGGDTSADGNVNADGANDDEGDQDDDGGSSGTGENTGYFLGMMEASTFTVFEAGVAEVGGELVEYDADQIRAECSGAVSFSIDEDDQVSGEASCASDNPVSMLRFEVTGSLRDGTVKGLISLELNGELLSTPVEGDLDGDEIELAFDYVHGEGENRFELDGTISATQVE